MMPLWRRQPRPEAFCFGVTVRVQAVLLDTISQQRIDGFGSNFAQMCLLAQGRTDYILEVKGQGGLLWASPVNMKHSDRSNLLHPLVTNQCVTLCFGHVEIYTLYNHQMGESKDL